MIDLTTAFAVSISEGNARLSIFVAEHICQSVLRHRVGMLMAGLRVGRSSNIVPKPESISYSSLMTLMQETLVSSMISKFMVRQA